ncbi:MAG TPA: TetR/AcrR family transcriptional regulator [Dissulfurispiraceae bacterium]|nr:TetR/AcrR family transcriptional regulator [Dissulfurispiraceae bacterium]
MPKGRISTRERIVLAALRLFSEKGYLGATTKEISAESGVAEVTLFRHFPSKESLLREVLSTYTFLPALLEILPSVEAMPYEKALSEIARRFIETLRLRKDLVKIMHSECHLYPEKIKGVQNAFLTELLDILAGFFKSRRKMGDLKNFDEFLAARLFLSMFYQYFITKEVLCLGLVSNYSDDSVIEGYVNIFSRGTKK